MLFNRLLLSNVVWVWLLNDKNVGLECRHSVVVSRKKYDEWKWYFFGVEICCPLYGSCVGRTKKPSFSILTFYLLTAQQNSHLLQCLLNVKVIMTFLAVCVALHTCMFFVGLELKQP